MRSTLGRPDTLPLLSGNRGMVNTTTHKHWLVQHVQLQNTYITLAYYLINSFASYSVYIHRLTLSTTLISWDAFTAVSNTVRFFDFMFFRCRYVNLPGLSVAGGGGFAWFSVVNFLTWINNKSKHIRFSKKQFFKTKSSQEKKYHHIQCSIK